MSENKKRVNGFSWPPDKAQIIAWLVMIYFAISVFSCFCISLSNPWSYSIAVVLAIIFLVQATFNIWCMATNPGEEALAKRKISPEPVFDRRKHKHVIENHFCRICLIAVSTKAKHCRKCNKCITDFDHHCIYLNNCIGGRNYKIFILTIVSAFIASMCIFLLGFIEFIISFIDDQSFLTKKYYNPSNMSNTKAIKDENKFLPIFAPVPIAGWRAFVAITTILAMVASVLIGYLIAYHIFLAVKKMSTYDHTLKLKEESDKKEEMKRKKNNTSIEDIGQQKEFDAEPNKPEMIKLDEKYKKSSTSYFNQSENLSDLNYDLNIDRDYYKEQRRSDSIEDFKKENKSNRLFYHRNMNHSSALPCSNNELNNKYFLVQDENESSHESLSAAHLSARKLADKAETNSKSNIVRLPPISAVTKIRVNHLENDSFD